MNYKNRKYYEVWLYEKNEKGNIDYTYRSSKLIAVDKPLTTKEDVSECIKNILSEECRKKYMNNIIDSIISWSEMCYLEFVEWMEMTVVCK